MNGGRENKYRNRMIKTKTYTVLFLYQMIPYTYIYNIREREKMSHGHNDVTNALKTT